MGLARVAAGLRKAPGHAGGQSCGLSSDLQPWGRLTSTAPARSTPGLRPLICGVRGERKEANALVLIAKALGYSCQSFLHGLLTGAGCRHRVLGSPCPSPATLPVVAVLRWGTGLPGREPGWLLTYGNSSATGKDQSGTFTLPISPLGECQELPGQLSTRCAA